MSKTPTNTENKAVNEWLSLLYVIIFALMIRIFLVELFFVPTGSMKSVQIRGIALPSTVLGAYRRGWTGKGSATRAVVGDGKESSEIGNVVAMTLLVLVFRDRIVKSS